MFTVPPLAAMPAFKWYSMTAAYLRGLQNISNVMFNPRRNTSRWPSTWRSDQPPYFRLQRRTGCFGPACQWARGRTSTCALGHKYLFRSYFSSDTLAARRTIRHCTPAHTPLHHPRRLRDAAFQTWPPQCKCCCASRPASRCGAVSRSCRRLRHSFQLAITAAALFSSLAKVTLSVKKFIQVFLEAAISRCDQLRLVFHLKTIFRQHRMFHAMRPTRWIVLSSHRKHGSVQFFDSHT